MHRLCISGNKLAELDSETSGLVSVHHLATVFAIVSDPGEQQWLTVEFMDGSKLNYMSRTRVTPPAPQLAPRILI